jgi:hypothetical protein
LITLSGEKQPRAIGDRSSAIRNPQSEPAISNQQSARGDSYAA